MAPRISCPRVQLSRAFHMNGVLSCPCPRGVLFPHGDTTLPSFNYGGAPSSSRGGVPWSWGGDPTEDTRLQDQQQLLQVLETYGGVVFEQLLGKTCRRRNCLPWGGGGGFGKEGSCFIWKMLSWREGWKETLGTGGVTRFKGRYKQAVREEWDAVYKRREEV